MNTYFELLIKINPEIEDIVSEICFETLPCTGVILAEETYKDLEMVSTTEGTLKVFLSQKPDGVQSVLLAKRKLLKSRGFSDAQLGSWEISLSEKENKDWSEKWKENWDITRVSNKITVVPDWIEYEPEKDEIAIRLEPGCAFGTGTHATTQLCMLAIEKYMKKGDYVADIGTGSGILAICASKFGAEFVFGCDNDETVIAVAAENARKNGAACIFECKTADMIMQKFDFVLANILHNVLAEIMPDLKNILNPGGILVLSGILNEKKQVVLDSIAKCGLQLLSENHINQWTAFTVRRL